MDIAFYDFGYAYVFSACAGANPGILPEKLVTNNDAEISISFGEGTYALLVGTNTVQGTYTAEKYSNNCVAVICEVEASTVNDGNEHHSDEFYFFSSDLTTWEYYGENYYGLAPGTAFIQKENCRCIPVAEIQEYSTPKTDGKYQGADVMLDELTIDDLTPDGKMIFDVFWYRTASIDDCDAKVYGNFAAFCYRYMDDSQETWGIIRFAGERETMLTLFTSGLPYIESRAYQYSFLSDSEILQQQEDAAKSDLVKNDATRGWKKDGENTYLRFRSDGTVDCWIGHFPVLESTIDGYTWNYEIDGDKIIINGYEYEYTSMIGGGAAFAYYFKATGDDPYLLAGEFALSDAGIYPMLASGQYGVNYH